MNDRKFNPGRDTTGRKEVLRALAESSVYRGFAKNFSRTTGLPVSLTPVESWQLAHHGQPRESPFCALLAQHSPACAACLQTQQKVATRAAQSARTVECIHGLSETAVPVRAGEHLLGFVRTGQVFRQTPTRKGFERVLKRLARWDVTLDTAKLRAAYFATRVMAPAHYQSSVGLLNFLARHLAILSNHILLGQVRDDIPMIGGAKKFIEANSGEKITLQQVAKSVHVSKFYLSKKFKQATGINFSRYVSHLRIEKAKNLLLNPYYRISEICYAVGFSSLTHFNRVFVRITGLSPSTYRDRLDTGQNGHPRTNSTRNNCSRTGSDPGRRPARSEYIRGTEAPNRRALERLSRESISAGSKANAVCIPLLTCETVEPQAVKTKAVRSGVLEHSDWPARMSRLQSGQENHQTVAPALRYFERINP